MFFYAFFGDLPEDFLLDDSNLVSSLICSIFAYTFEIICAADIAGAWSPLTSSRGASFSLLLAY